jgi:predicted nucleic acid-binding protein
MIIVSNSTPLIALSKIGKLELLREYFGVVHIPKEVYDEVVTRGKNLFGAMEVKNADWIKVEEVRNKIAVESLLGYIGQGEAEAIIVAKERNTKLLLIDDSDGRQIAERLGLKITGTIGILLLAATDKKIVFKDTLDDLEYLRVWGVGGGRRDKEARGRRSCEWFCSKKYTDLYIYKFVFFSSRAVKELSQS